MLPTFSRTCSFLSHSADENAAQDEQRFFFLRAMCRPCWRVRFRPCSMWKTRFGRGWRTYDYGRSSSLLLGLVRKARMSFILQAFSIRDERVISAGLAREWYIVLAMDETKSKHKETKLPELPRGNNPSQPKGVFARIKAPFNAAFPVMIGYVFPGHTLRYPCPADRA